MKLPIYHNKMKCYLCSQENEIHHPEVLAFEQGVGNINEIYSTTRGRKNIGNICSSCGAFQSNVLVKEWLMKHIYDDDFQDRMIWIDKDVYCIHCGGLIEDNEIPIGWELHQRIMGIFECKNCKSHPPK